jgi:nucleotide-binding universal stress UspA family protein
MEKILLVINAHRPDTGQIDFACSIAKLAGSKLTGVFIENIYWEYQPIPGIDGLSYFNWVIEEDATSVIMETKQAITVFKDQCELNGVAGEVYIDHGEPVREVLFETRYADLLIVDPRIAFYEMEEDLPTYFAKQVLHKAECPVLIAPERFSVIDEIVFCYDATASSVFAIKQFIYHFPALLKNKIIVLEVSRSGDERFDEHKRRMMDLLSTHFKTISYQTLKGNPRSELFDYFLQKENKMIVMGAYGRSLISRLFKKSKADPVIEMIDLPVFITHH